MESATLQSKAAPAATQQRSLSLPSYARAGGEGIDHRLIFAALEQKERVRRKSRLFVHKEKRQNSNIFCLPIKSSNRCRETSLSSDTSCSSLEYQKPIKGKKEEVKGGPKNGKALDKPLPIKPSAADPQSDVAATTAGGQGLVNGSGAHGLHLAIHVDSAYRDHVSNETRPRGVRSHVAEFRSGIGSSGDSMERSSRSSSDSLSRKERMVALKARVEAQREKFGRGSSSEDEQPRMTHYNSDDVIHRTVREVKSRSSRIEKRMRRRSQDEWMLKRAVRRQNVSSLYIAPGDEDLFGNYHGHEEPEVVKTDFCPSPQFPDLLKKNYFSDFPSRENMSRFVKDRIKCIEDEEMRRRLDSTTKAARSPLEKEINGLNRTLTPLQISASLPADRSRDGLIKPSSPTPKSPQAPTPPPRSPKSLTFVNKAFLQHQNATSYLRQEDRSLERKPLFEANIRSLTKPAATPSEELAMPSETARRTRELMSSRRKTCSNFGFLQDICLNGSTTTPIENPKFNKHSALDHEYPLYCVINGRANYAKGSFTNMEKKFQREMNSTTETKVNLLKNKWNEIEQMREMQFNSLESKNKPVLPSWIKRKCEPEKHSCLCSSISNGKQNCFCYPREHVFTSVSSNPSNKYENVYSRETFNLSVRSSPSNRLSKSEANIAAVLQPKISQYNVQIEEIPLPVKYKETSFPIDKMFESEKQNQQSATANLESAMEELESVYQSLKFNSDNLSEKNSLTNASDEDFRPNYNILLQNKLNFSRNTLLKPSGSCPVIRAVADNAKVCEVSKSFPSCSAESFKTYEASRKFPNPAAVSHSNITASPPRSSVSETLCIDEMFNDLTRQLDFEQKLLKESREHKTQSQSASHSRSVLEDKTAHQKHTSPLESIVSIRRELYNNLYGEDTTTLKTDKTDVAKKKHKAVRSLSANISYLMGADKVNMVSGPDIRKSSTSGVNRPDRAGNLMDDRESSPHSRNYISSATTLEGSRSPFGHGMTLTSDLPKLDRNQYQKSNEIRQIRVSMDTSSKPTAGRTDTNSFSRMTPVLCQPRSKSPLPGFGLPETPADAAQITTAPPLDAMDEAALEELLRSLLVDTPARCPAPPGESSENVILFKRNFCLKTMDACMTPNPKNDASKLELPTGNKDPKDQKEAQRLNDTSQNNNAHPKMSFIPVYSKRSDVCHNLPRHRKDSEAKPNLPEVPAPQIRSVLSFSPPHMRKNIIDKEVLSARTRSHLRRHSVGFEDLTSATYCYGRNFTNDKRFQTVAHNPNISSTSIGSQLTQTESVVTANYEKPEAMNPTNYNAKLSLGGNENETVLMGNEKPLLQRLEKLKDKSFKRKSSLNRIDFIHLPMPSKGKVLDKVSKCDREQRNSSSDENDGSRPSQKPSQSLSKKKHNFSVAAENRWERKTDEVALSHESATNSARSKVFPRFNPLKLRNRKINYANASHFEKLSYSAGELESLASDKTSNSKTCLSAQEFDGKDNGRAACMYQNSRYIDNPLRALNLPTGAAFVKNTSRNCGRVANTCDTASQNGIETTNQSLSSSDVKDEINCSAAMRSCEHELCVPRYDNVPLDCMEQSLYVTNSPPERCNLESAEKGIYQEEVSLVNADTSSCIEESTSGLQYLEISANGIEYSMSEDNNEQDPERRPSSILRKSYSEERRELHGILKPTPEEKLPRTTLPSILKHRDSSEEKEAWPQQNDLHSILKKSASEDESYNSSTDVMIRPILKNNASTDDECSSGGGNTRPRPILKKRTSFQEECSYACYASGELKPILKKNKSLSSGSSEDQQPKPILKTRRKSEDGQVAAVMAEVATRPRAYSADMGVKERFGGSGSNEGYGFEREDSASKKCDQTDL